MLFNNKTTVLTSKTLKSKQAFAMVNHTRKRVMAVLRKAAMETALV